jgi:hypothetical protein
LKGGEPSFLQFLEFPGVLAIQLFVLIGVHRWLVALRNYLHSSASIGGSKAVSRDSTSCSNLRLPAAKVFSDFEEFA